MENDLKKLNLNRAERRKVQNEIAKSTGKNKEDIDAQDVLKYYSEQRKKQKRKLFKK